MPLLVHLDQLVALLARQAEASDLDYKGTWDPASKPDLIELCKDVAAMESLPAGGYVVVGATSSGDPSSLFAPGKASDYDEQKIRSKVARTLGEPIDFSSALHTWQGNSYLLIGIGPNRDGMRIMHKDGEYSESTVWRQGDVFVRRGTSSMRWNQHEARGVIERVVAARKEEWREDVFETIRRATPALDQGGFVNVTSEMPVDSFTLAVTELIRRADIVGLDVLSRRTINSALAVVDRASSADFDEPAGGVELGQELDRLNLVAALSARYQVPSAFDEVLEGYRSIYGANDNEYMEYPQKFKAGHRVILVHLFALGAVLVNERRWDQVALLARLTPLHTHNGYWTSLLRKAEVMTARSESLATPDGESSSRVGVIANAEPVTKRLFNLLDEDRDVDATTLLVQFDVMRGIATAGPDTSDRDKLGAYTNFALYSSARAEPAFLTVLKNEEVRSALFQGDVDHLRSVYRRMNEVALHEGMRYNGWDGFESPQLREFTSEP